MQGFAVLCVTTPPRGLRERRRGAATEPGGQLRVGVSSRGRRPQATAREPRANDAGSLDSALPDPGHRQAAIAGQEAGATRPRRGPTASARARMARWPFQALAAASIPGRGRASASRRARLVQARLGAVGDVEQGRAGPGAAADRRAREEVADRALQHEAVGVDEPPGPAHAPGIREQPRLRSARPGRRDRRRRSRRRAARRPARGRPRSAAAPGRGRTGSSPAAARRAGRPAPRVDAVLDPAHRAVRAVDLLRRRRGQDEVGRRVRGRARSRSRRRTRPRRRC